MRELKDYSGRKNRPRFGQNQSQELNLDNYTMLGVRFKVGRNSDDLSMENVQSPGSQKVPAVAESRSQAVGRAGMGPSLTGHLRGRRLGSRNDSLVNPAGLPI